MEYKSNVNIASNIFIRKNSDVIQDPDFVHNCRGRKALSELSQRVFGTTSGVKLTQTQNNELQDDVSCALAYDKQMTHGPVLISGNIIWDCRCEYDSCINFAKCMPIPIVRERKDTVAVNTTQSVELKYEWLGTIEKVEFLFKEPEIKEPEIDIEEPIPEEYTEAPDVEPNEFIPIYEPDSIIYADLDSRILVNAGPGTGKTHTVIERLEYIIETGKVELGQVLVLCYTNAARDVILERLDEKGLSAEARQLVICTFDSLAWNNLSEKTEDDLFALGYNGCIERFNKDFHADEWSDFEYVIIDELQDLVNERARMTINIMKALQCGYLLLGDNCQAIYDYDCDGENKIDSVKFYEMIDETLPPDALKYELKGNRRQSAHLSRFTDDLRDALSSFSTSEVNDYFKVETEAMTSEQFSPVLFSDLPKGVSTAILTRNNGEAEWISARLRKKGIPHNLIRSVTSRLSLHRWIADVFWDYRLPTISKNDFIERYIIRVKGDEIAAENAYYGVLSLLKPDSYIDAGYLNVQSFTKSLRRWENVSDVLINTQNELLTVSTIHKAKGREFDHVYVLNTYTSIEDNTQEARVEYVADTRPKEKLFRLSKGSWYLRKPKDTARWIGTGRGWYTNTIFCNKVVIGLLNDIDTNSFINGDLEHAIKIQKHIATRVKINDVVDICLVNNVYEIYHQDICIGSLSNEARDSIRASIQNVIGWGEIPPRLTNTYVSNIVTVSRNLDATKADSMFKDSQLWLGVELSGFAEADWKWEGTGK